MTVAAAYAQALAAIPRRHRAWLEAFDIELWSYYGLGIMLTDPQLEHLNDVLDPTRLPGTIHVWRWANRTGKTTGLDILHGFAAWYKWRYENADVEDWLGYRYKTLHVAPLNELAGKAHELWAEIIMGTSIQQRDPFTNRQRPGLLLPFFEARTDRDTTGVDRPVLRCANGSKVDFRSTQGGAPRLESDAWWFVVWDEFPRQAPIDDIPVIFDQTLLPRTSDFSAPIVLSGTATIDAEPIYAELEELAAAEPAMWNFTSAARSTNFSQTRQSIERQRKLAIDKDTVDRSVDGKLGSGSNSIIPGFVLANAFDETLPEEWKPPTSEPEWAAFGDAYANVTVFDHALSADDNVLFTARVPWPISRISLDEPVEGVNLEIIRSSRTLTPAEQQSYLAREVETYRSRWAIIDSTGEGGIGVYRTAKAAGLPAVDCNFQGRAAKFVTNKEYGVQALQRLLAYGLELPVSGIIDQWPDVGDAPYGVLRFPTGGDWQRMRRQLAVYRRWDEKLKQDCVMVTVMLAWFLWRLMPNRHANTKPREPVGPFNIARGRQRRIAMTARR